MSYRSLNMFELSKRIFTAACAVSALFFSSTTFAQNDPLPGSNAASALFDRSISGGKGDEIVALVGNDVITRAELNHRVLLYRRELQARGLTAGTRSELERQVLDFLVNDKVLINHARGLGMELSDAQVDLTIASIAENANMPVDQLIQQMQADGLTTEQIRQGIRDEITLDRLREAATVSEPITDAELENAMQERFGPLALIEEINIAQIMLPISESATVQEQNKQRQQMEAIRKQLEAGQSFELMAKTYSKSSEADRGGVMGYRSIAGYPTLFVGAVKNLKPNQLSAIIRSGAGLHLLKLLGRRTIETPQIESQVHYARILIRIHAPNQVERAAQYLAAIRERIVAQQISFSDAARQYSQDTATRSLGGDMGWQTLESLDATFLRKINQLQIGELSQPLQTMQGLELILLKQRADRALTLEQKQAIARQSILTSRRESVLNKLLQELKSQTYIEIRI